MFSNIPLNCLLLAIVTARMPYMAIRAILYYTLYQSLTNHFATEETKNWPLCVISLRSLKKRPWLLKGKINS